MWNVIYSGRNQRLSDYDLLILPALYAADEKLLLHIADYVEQEGICWRPSRQHLPMRM